MKILLISEFGSPHSRIRSYMKAFRGLGHEISTINTTDYYSLNPLNRVLNWFLKPPRYYGAKKINDEIKNRALSYKPDMAFFIKPIYIKPETILALKKSKTIVFSFIHDSVFFWRNVSKVLLEAMPFYDCVFTINPLEVDELMSLGAKKAMFLPPAVDTKLMYPVALTDEEKERLGADVVFIGTYAAGEKREKYLEGLCRAGYDVKVYGNRWQKCRKCRCLKKNNSLMYKAYYGEDFSKVVNSGKIVINFLREHDKDTIDSRTYELPACGAFMLHERTKEATEFFKEGKEAEFFGSFEELVEKIDHYFAHPEERNRIASAGHKRVLEHDCGFGARAEQLLEAYRKIKNNINDGT